jgi:hypothetical protein
MPPPYDTHPALGHPEVAGWVLGVLDSPDAEAFAKHLRSCTQCKAEIAKFASVASALEYPVSDDEPPSDLGARTIAAVQSAAMAANRPGPAAEAAPSKAARWWHWHWNVRLMSVATALAGVVAAALLIGFQVFSSSTPEIAISLHAQPGFTGSGLATPHRTDGGWSIKLTVDHLKPLPLGQFYECWYAGPANRPGHPELITAGTFVVGPSGRGTFNMWSAANPDQFRTMQITEERPGDASQHGQVVLSGTVQSS